MVNRGLAVVLQVEIGPFRRQAGASATTGLQEMVQTMRRKQCIPRSPVIETRPIRNMPQGDAIKLSVGLSPRCWFVVCEGLSFHEFSFGFGRCFMALSTLLKKILPCRCIPHRQS